MFTFSKRVSLELHLDAIHGSHQSFRNRSLADVGHSGGARPEPGLWKLTRDVRARSPERLPATDVCGVGRGGGRLTAGFCPG